MPRAVILTALSVEYLAVCAHLSDLREEVHLQGTIYERGQFEANGQAWDIGIVEIGAGNTGAALEAERAIAYFNPDVILFVGVAGGIKDVALGDVVASTKIYGYESGKAEERFKPRPEIGLSAYNLEQRARVESRKGDWVARLSSVAEPKPRVFVAPIAAGEKVIASTQSEICKFLKENYGDAIAVEMEGLGFLGAARANQKVSAMVIRGISDLIDGKGETDNAGFQEIASHHASAFAFAMLAKLDLNDESSNVIDPKQPLHNRKQTFQDNATRQDNPSSLASDIEKEATSLQQVSPDAESASKIYASLKLAEGLRKDGYFPESQILYLNTLKQKFSTISDWNRELQIMLEQSESLLDNAKQFLDNKLSEINANSEDIFDGSEIKDDRAELTTFIEILNQFKATLNTGKKPSQWLDKNRRRISQEIGRQALFHSEKDLNSSDLNIKNFYYSLELFLELISHAIKWGRFNSLDFPEIRLCYPKEIYRIALNSIEDLFPVNFKEEERNQINEYIQYLLTRPPIK